MTYTRAPDKVGGVVRDWAKCVWCEHGFSTHNSLLVCCVYGCDCKHLEMKGDMLDQLTMDICV